MNSNESMLFNISQLLGPLLSDEELTNIHALPLRPESVRSSEQAESICSKLDLAESEVCRLYSKQEYFRNAYNETLNRMHNLLTILPNYLHEYLPRLDNDYKQTAENHLFDPELVEFLIETKRHQENRNLSKHDDLHTTKLIRAPPNQICENDSKTSKQSQIDNIRDRKSVV